MHQDDEAKYEICPKCNEGLLGFVRYELSEGLVREAELDNERNEFNPFETFVDQRGRSDEVCMPAVFCLSCGHVWLAEGIGNMPVDRGSAQFVTHDAARKLLSQGWIENRVDELGRD